MKYLQYIFLVVIVLVTACEWDSIEEEDTTEVVPVTPTISYNVLKTYPHDTDAFTEGLFFDNGKLYESTGGTMDFPQTKSLFGIVDTNTGEINAKVTLDKNQYFGEGIALLNNKIYQLTYKSRKGFVYDAKSYAQLQEFTIPSAEGWGLTTDGTYLIMSDGSNRLTYLDPVNLQTVKVISVRENGFAVDLLNELEFINGYLYANIYTTNTIVKIDPITGELAGRMDLTNLAIDARNNYPMALDMNGIAYNSNTNRIWITGKFWPKIFEIEIIAPL